MSSEQWQGQLGLETYGGGGEGGFVVGINAPSLGEQSGLGDVEFGDMTIGGFQFGIRAREYRPNRIDEE